MKKLSKDDIIILTEGQQVRNAILQKYNSIEQFITQNNIGILPSTIEEYLNKKIITSQKFKLTLVLSLDSEYNKIVLNEFEQIEKYIDIITDNMELYREKDDIQLLELLKDLCLKRNMITCTAKMYRIISKYNFRNNNPKVALEQIKFAVDLIKDKNEENLYVIFLCELALIYLFQADNEKSNKTFELAEKIVNQSTNINDHSKYFYYSTYGCLLFSIDKHSKARSFFKKAIDCTSNTKKIGQITINIGATYEKESKYSKSLEYYEKALEYLAENDVTNRGIAYNNISKVYIIKGDYDLALENSTKAIEYFKENLNNPASISCYLNYFHIKLNKSDVENVLDEFIQIIDNMSRNYVYKAINEYLTYFIETGRNLKDDRIIKRIETYISVAIKRCKSEDYRNMLVNHLGNISLYKNERGSKYGKTKVFSQSDSEIPPDIKVFVVGKNKNESVQSDIIDYRINSKNKNNVE